MKFQRRDCNLRIHDAQLSEDILSSNNSEFDKFLYSSFYFHVCVTIEVNYLNEDLPQLLSLVVKIV